MAFAGEEFETVIFLGVVAGCDVATSVEFVFVDGVIQEWGGAFAHVCDVAAGFGEALDESFLQVWA